MCLFKGCTNIATHPPGYPSPKWCGYHYHAMHAPGPVPGFSPFRNPKEDKPGLQEAFSLPEELRASIGEMLDVKSRACFKRANGSLNANKQISFAKPAAPPKFNYSAHGTPGALKTLVTPNPNSSLAECYQLQDGRLVFSTVFDPDDDVVCKVFITTADLRTVEILIDETDAIVVFFHQYQQHYLLIGTAEHVIYIWDLRTRAQVTKLVLPVKDDFIAKYIIQTENQIAIFYRGGEKFIIKITPSNIKLIADHWLVGLQEKDAAFEKIKFSSKTRIAYPNPHTCSLNIHRGFFAFRHRLNFIYNSVVKLPNGSIAATINNGKEIALWHTDGVHNIISRDIIRLPGGVNIISDLVLHDNALMVCFADGAVHKLDFVTQRSWPVLTPRFDVENARNFQFLPNGTIAYLYNYKDSLNQLFELECELPLQSYLILIDPAIKGRWWISPKGTYILSYMLLPDGRLGIKHCPEDFFYDRHWVHRDYYLPATLSFYELNQTGNKCVLNQPIYNIANVLHHSNEETEGVYKPDRNYYVTRDGTMILQKSECEIEIMKLPALF